MVGNILGVPVDKWVSNEIARRQLIHGTGIDGTKRSPEIQNYLNNRSPWIKLASGVSLTNTTRLTDVTKNDIGAGITRAIAQNYTGHLLAENFILFNTLSALENTSYAFRKGVKNSKKVLDLLAQYGGVGSVNQGLQPTPGIIDISVSHINRGSIKKAKVKLKAYNKIQFAIIELLYLRLGFTVMLEWGWDKDSRTLKDIGSTIIEQAWFTGGERSQTQMISAIKNYQEIYSGNYGGFFGKVSNFTWSYNKDGTYDITLDLMSMGDVIESLVTNIGFEGLGADAVGALQSNYENFKTSFQYGLDKTEFNKDPDTELTAAAESDLLIEIASTDALTNFLFVSQISLQKGVEKGDFFNIRDAAYNQYGGTIVRSVPPMKNYYVRFGKLLSFIRSNILPTVKIGSSKENLIDIEINEKSCIVSAFQNQVSLDPTKVLINPRFSPGINDQFTKTDDKPIGPLFLNKLKPYTVEKNGVIYGQLMNLYLNTDYIIKLVKNKKNNKNQVPLFEFLKEICNTINKSLGSVNNIEPIIKNEKIITIIDQNPIPGISKIAGDLGIEGYSNPSTAINVYGYGEKTASFLKNISFSTKIGPELATMITVGATASGTKNYDSSLFSKWNEGLKDRFNEEIEEPKYTPSIAVNSSTVDIIGDIKKDTESIESLIKLKSSFHRQKYLESSGKIDITEGSISSDRTGRNFIKKKVGTTGLGFVNLYEETFVGYTLPIQENGKTAYKFFPAENYPDNSAGYQSFIQDASTYLKEEQAKVTQTQSALAASLEEVKNSYEGWLVQAFGGTAKKPNNTSVNIALTGSTGDDDIDVVSQMNASFTGGGGAGSVKTDKATCEGEGQSSYFVQYENTKYFNFEENDFYSRGQKLFKEAQNIKNIEIASETNAASNTIGFIPLEFKLDIDGMTGFKLYNSLFINQQFLPQQYPKAMKFLITAHDHKVSSKGWTTTLKTISVPITEANPNIRLADQLTLDQLQALEASLPSHPIPPNQNLGTGGTFVAPDGTTFDISNPTSIDVTSPSGFPTITVDKKTKQPKIIAGNENKYLNYIGDIDKRPGLKRYFFDTVTKKTAVVIHHTAGWSKGDKGKNTSFGWQKKADKVNYPIATQYIITQDGHVELCFNEAFWSYHASIGTQDKYTIGIELQALGYMKRKKDRNGDIYYERSSYDKKTGKTKYTTINKKNAKGRVVSSLTNVEDVNLDTLFSQPVDENGNIISWRGYDYFQKYSPEQLQALERVLRGIKSRHPQIDFTYNYNLLFPKKPIYNGDPKSKKFIGLKNKSMVITHNTTTGKTDVFPQKELLSLLKRMGTELGPSKPLPNGKFYGQDGNFTTGPLGGGGTLGAAETQSQNISEAQGLINIMLDIVDSLYREARGLSAEFGGVYQPRELGDKNVAGSEVNRFWYSASKLKELIKLTPDDLAISLFRDTLNNTWKKEKWALIQIGTKPTFTLPGVNNPITLNGYASPNSFDSDLEYAWEELRNGDSFLGGEVEF